MCSTSAKLLPAAGASTLLAAVEAFGGLDNLRSDIGASLGHALNGPSVVFRLEIPSCQVRVVTPAGSGTCVVAGSRPLLVEGGSFLEHANQRAFDALSSALGQADPVTANTSALRAALLQFLSAPSHLSCLRSEITRVPGIDISYQLNARSLVVRSLKTLRSATQFRYVLAGAVASPIVYIAAHRMIGMPPAEAIPIALSAIAAAWAAAIVSMRITLATLLPDVSSRIALQDAIDRASP